MVKLPVCCDPHKGLSVVSEAEVDVFLESQQTVENSESDENTCLLRSLYAGQEETEPDKEQQTGFKLGKGYIKAIYCHLVYLYA